MPDWLSNLDPFDPGRWSAAATVSVRVSMIIVIALVVSRLLQRLVRLLRERLTRDIEDTERMKRAETLTRALRYFITVAVTLVASTLVLSELGVSIAPILGAAGVAGVAIGFGAQSLIKDYFGGFFLLLENQVRQGDVAELGGKTGLVEEITLRYVRLRDYAGHVHYVPNGLITTVTNMSRGFARAVVDVGVAYREDVDEVMQVMLRVGEELRGDPVFGPKILEPLEMSGVERWDDSAVVVRCRFTVVPLEQWAVRREYLRRLKTAFDAAGIEIPFPHLTVYAGVDKDGTAPPFRLARAASRPIAERGTA
jgi:small conductance mechanosensitive channel